MATSKKHLILYLVFIVCSIFASCSGDERIEQTPVDTEYAAKVKEILKDSIVLRSKAMMATVDKTLLPEGCPLKYYFHWNEGSDKPLNIQLKNFSVGKMPVQIWFNIDCKLTRLNSWERDEYKGDGWVKFIGEYGATNYMPNKNDTQHEYENGDGGSGYVQGYLNVNTKQIEFSTNFNVMLMQSYVYLQTIDYSKMDTFEEDFAKFEEDLEKYKQAHGL